MHEASALALHAVLIGMGATATMDAWTMLRKMPDYGLVGRWIAYLPRGRLRHDPIAATPSVQGEEATGWIAHYLLGVAFAALLLIGYGIDWIHRPTLVPALLVGTATVVAPYFILQPGMGLGLAARRARQPAMARLHSLITHAVFGLGMYLAAQAVSSFAAWVQPSLLSSGSI